MFETVAQRLPAAKLTQQQDIAKAHKLLIQLEDEDPSVFVSALGHLVKKHGVADVAEVAGLHLAVG